MQKTLEARSFIGLLILVSITFLVLLAPFFGVIFWSVAIAIIFAPVQNRILLRTHSPNLSAFLTLVLCSVIVVIPFLIIVSSFLEQGLAVYQGLQSGQIQPEIFFKQIEQAFPGIQEFLRFININPDEIQTKFNEFVVFLSKFIAQQTLAISQNTFNLIIQTGILLYVTFFMLRDKNELVRYLHRALPLGDAREALLFNKFSEVTRATIKGSLMVAVVQGSLGGFIFWVLDINAALLWGVVMTIFSLIPMVGSAFVWAPVAIFFLATADYVSGITLILFGVIVIGLVDNILRPILVGRDTKLPDYLVLLSTLGGFMLFGMNGFITGPLIAVLFITCWNIFITDFNKEELIEEHADTHIEIHVDTHSEAHVDTHSETRTHTEST